MSDSHTGCEWYNRTDKILDSVENHKSASLAHQLTSGGNIVRVSTITLTS